MTRMTAENISKMYRNGIQHLGETWRVHERKNTGRAWRHGNWLVQSRRGQGRWVMRGPSKKSEQEAIDSMSAMLRA